MKTTIYKLGEEMGHDIQITAKSVCTYSESEYNGKKCPRTASYPHAGGRSAISWQSMRIVLMANLI